MSVPWMMTANFGDVLVTISDESFFLHPDDAAELLRALESDPALFLAELRAAVDEAHKQRRAES